MAFRPFIIHIPSTDMELPTTLFGVDYNRHRLIHLEYFLESASRPFELHSTKRVLFSNLVAFERSLNAADQDTLRTLTRRFYHTINAGYGAVVRRELRHTLKSISQKEEVINEETISGNRDSKNSHTQVQNSVLSRKRKRSEISKGTKRKGRKAQASKFRDCSVCYEKIPFQDFPEANITSECKHGNDVCAVCIKSHVDARIEIGQFGFINCPVCPETLGLEDIRRLCSSDTFERYDRLVTRTTIEKDPTFHFCLHGCGSGQYVTDSSNKMKCGQCANTTCIRHAIPWHDGMTCEEYDEKYVNDSENSYNDSPVQSKPAANSTVSGEKKKGVEGTRREESRRKIQNSRKEKAQEEKAQRAKAERENAMTETIKKEKFQREKSQKISALKEKARKEKLEREKLEREKLEREKAERERAQREKVQKERVERERAVRERIERERAERERAERERAERERIERERAERGRAEWERAERERVERERVERDRAIKEAEALRRKRAKDDKASQETLERISKTCPNKDCGAPIQKTGGCDYMRCTRCRQEFCWRCMQAWFGDHLQNCTNLGHWRVWH